MKKMNSTRCSRLVALLVVATLALSAVVPAAAFSTSDSGVPSDAAVEEEVSATLTVTELYENYEEWTLHGETELTGVTWKVVQYDQAGNKIGEASNAYDGQSFNQSVSIDSDASKIEVKVTGTVPEVENFTYADQQTFELATLDQVRQGGNTEAIASWTPKYHTDASKEARSAISDAEAAIEDAPSGADTSEAESDLDSAITAYNGENFDLAVELADKATEKANTAAKKAEQSKQQSQLLMYGGIAVVLLLLVGGGVYWYRSQQGNTSKLK
ncbi:hypothetical protein [Halomicrococcus gelatinilyticus]|uniref:hypothetical protein n=1 Tax=Halomicrococcus gelatinilyticus TaxID=1702103 RepID=UPI002E0EFE2F